VSARDQGRPLRAPSRRDGEISWLIVEMSWFVVLTLLFAASLLVARRAFAFDDVRLVALTFVLSGGVIALSTMTAHAAPTRRQGCALWLLAIPLTTLMDGPATGTMMALATLLAVGGLERFTQAARARTHGTYDASLRDDAALAAPDERSRMPPRCHGPLRVTDAAD